MVVDSRRPQFHLYHRSGKECLQIRVQHLHRKARLDRASQELSLMVVARTGSLNSVVLDIQSPKGVISREY